MFLKNQVVYVQFHPVVYMVKLNIEMSMASLVVRLAQGKPQNDMAPEQFHSSTDPTSQHRRTGQPPASIQLTSRSKRGVSGLRSPGLSKIDSDESLGGIECRTDLNVTVEHVEKGQPFVANHSTSSRSSREASRSVFDQHFGDETPLHKNHIRVMERAV